VARILLIDDDSLFRSMLSKTLAHFGHTVIEAPDGKEGLKLFPQVNPDLLITDIVMPEKDGFEVLVELRKHRPVVKIIVISGGLRGKTEVYLEMARRLGSTKVLAKPFSIEALIEAINELLPAGEGPAQLPGPV
jgi:DNA-binding response OmpR family regulator